MKVKIIIGTLVSLLAVNTIVARAAFAALGGSADSIEKDRKALAIVRSSTTTAKKYTIVESGSAMTSVREYLSPSGVVFGVAWAGMVHPDLTVLLGVYSDEYSQARARTSRRHNRGPVRLSTSRIVVEKWGHARRLKGRAYAPALIPSGVSIDEIR